MYRRGRDLGQPGSLERLRRGNGDASGRRRFFRCILDVGGKLHSPIADLAMRELDFDKSIMKYPNISRYVGGASTDLVPDLQHPDNPVPLLKNQIDRLHIEGGGG